AAGAGLSVGVFTPRFGRAALMAGALVNAAGFAGYAWLSSHYGPGIHSWQMLVPLAVAGFGFGLVAAALVDLILTGVPVRDAGSGSGVLSTTQQVGMALGYALVGVIFFGLLASGSGPRVDTVPPAPARPAPPRRDPGARPSHDHHRLPGLRARPVGGHRPDRGPRQLPDQIAAAPAACRAAAESADAADPRRPAGQCPQLRPHLQRHHVVRGRRAGCRVPRPVRASPPGPGPRRRHRAARRRTGAPAMRVISAQAGLFTGSRPPKITIACGGGPPAVSRQRRRPEGPEPPGCERGSRGAVRGGRPRYR